MKRILIAFVAFSMFFTGCSRFFSKGHVVDESIRVGFIYPGEIKDNGYTQAHDAGRLAIDKIGVRTMYIENVPKDESAELAILSLIEQKCNLIYVTSNTYADYVYSVAEEYPDVKFAICAGEKTTPNVSCYFGKMYEARYLSGIVAGLKTTSNKIGYISAFETPECIRSINAFTIGVRSVNPDAKVYVRWTNSWDRTVQEESKTEGLLAFGCDIITQHQNSTVPIETAEKKGVYSIAYNCAVKSVAPKSYLTAACFRWDVFILEDVLNYSKGQWESRFYWEGLEKNLVSLDELSDSCAPGTKVVVNDAKKKLIEGKLHVFQGPLYDDSGNFRLDHDEVLSPSEIWNMDWFVEGVVVQSY
ncbi:MAG: BMP family ABC transporter substrate-binding protein [Treponema sp.]|nr:BMP family ABC transporter substrate-binding protein [Candidatus Treponema equi]